jgi:hypothetical protein
LGSGLNPRLENVLKQRSVAVEAAAAETATAKAENKTVGEVKILKGLQGLSPQLLEMLKAREKAKQIKSMTQSSQEQKELEMMEELIIVRQFFHIFFLCWSNWGHSQMSHGHRRFHASFKG